jgi:hypothetical protein
MGIAVCTRGNIYVVDQTNDRVQMFDADGSYLMNWGTSGAGAGQFNQPSGLTISSLGEIYVSAQGDHRIQSFRAYPLWYYQAEPPSVPD